MLSAVGLGSKMADCLPVLPFGISVLPDIHVPDDDDGVPDDLQVLPDDVLLIIAREYRLATAEDCSLDGWWRVHAEMPQLPRCPKRKQVINLKGFNIPRHGNMLEPVTGYFWRRLQPQVVPVVPASVWPRRLPSGYPGSRVALRALLPL